eukprot:TRINITY_DN16589_c0_g1_i1.p1 TRINITY_DN16589_c0_g1~~TRINITY_DN16589_c0_g1_i1.p1  ORF type:complete len:202 (+),score=28.75 TRINITY_DN16589_c0_g1_i1:316-921(+)
MQEEDFSGDETGAVVPKLARLAMLKIMDNIELLQDVGYLPDSHLSQILFLVTDPRQLMTLERNAARYSNRKLDTERNWENICKKHAIRQKADKRTWRTTYLNHIKGEQLREQKIKARLKGMYAKEDKHKQSNSARILGKRKTVEELRKQRMRAAKSPIRRQPMRSQRFAAAPSTSRQRLKRKLGNTCLIKPAQKRCRITKR